MHKHVEPLSMKQRVCALIASGALVASTAIAPITALATEATAGTQVGTGVTAVTIQYADDAEHGGTADDDSNPDGDDADDFGDNLAFSVPSAINFVAKADGTLVGPSASSTYIKNESAFSIYVSSVDVDSATNWNLVEDATAAECASTNNAFDFRFGPAGNTVNAHDYLTKGSISSHSDGSAWGMEAKRSSGSNSDVDKLKLTTSGHIRNLTRDISGQTQVATIHTYVTPGVAS